jgi:hypothetical protein
MRRVRVGHSARPVTVIVGREAHVAINAAECEADCNREWFSTKAVAAFEGRGGKGLKKSHDPAAGR